MSPAIRSAATSRTIDRMKVLAAADRARLSFITSAIVREIGSRTGQTAYQASARGGTLYCRYAGDRTYLSGAAVLFAESEIHLP